MNENLAFAWAVLEIVWINLLLSGDNAILIALACRDLAPKQRPWGIFLGGFGGLVLRVAFTFVMLQILSVPMLKTLGGLFVMVIAIKLATDGTKEAQIAARPNFWGSVFAIIVADATMSLDNVVAVAAAAQGSTRLVVFGLALCAPILMFGAGAILRVLDRFPFLVWGGAGLLGWIAGDLIASDPLWARFDLHAASIPKTAASLSGLLIVIAVGLLIRGATARKAR